jgi:hypothetical protein
LHFARKRGVTKDCNSCKPLIHSSNEDVIEVWSYVHDQIIIAPMGGAVSINIVSVYETMDRLGIRDQMNCLRKIKYLFSLLNEAKPNNPGPSKR